MPAKEAETFQEFRYNRNSFLEFRRLHASMNRFQNDIEIVHDLLLIQQDRVIAYETICRYNDQDEVICRFLRKIAVQCRNSFLELRRHIDLSYGDPADRVEIKGEIYRDWPGVKQFLPCSQCHEIIHACEWNEIRAAIAYQKALTSGENLSRELKQIIYNQLKEIRESFRFIHECKEKPTAPAIGREEAPPHFTFSV